MGDRRMAAAAEQTWWVWAIGFCVCYVACALAFFGLPVIGIGMQRSAHDGHAGHGPPYSYPFDLAGKLQYDTLGSGAYAGRPYTDYLDGLFDVGRDLVAYQGPQKVVVLRQGDGQQQEMPPATECVLVDGAGRYLGAADTYAAPVTTRHGGVVAAFDDFMLQYTPTKPGARYEYV